ncbi:hypothetical protein A2U01_0091821, partial [Trifolium medium]|nr:hypothetical protein [Trifolium medium]
LTPFYK